MVTTQPARTHIEVRQRHPLFSALIGLCALAVLLQGLWAGIFIQPHANQSWIEVHARGGEVAIALAAASAVVAFWKLRHRRELWIGSAALAVLLVFEAFIGGLIRDQGQDTLTAIHVPLAMALMGLVVWLPLRAVRPPAR